MKTIKLGLLVCAAGLLTLAGGCESGGGGGGPSGQSTIEGNVSSFPSGGTVAGIAQSGGQGGIRVEVAGTDLSGETADDGSFVISGVPGGAQTLEFARGGIQKSLGVNVPEHGVVHLDDVKVDDSGIHVRHSSTDVLEDTRHSGLDDGPNHDLGDDHGVDDPSHDAGDDKGVDGSGHDVGDDKGGSSGSGKQSGKDDGSKSST